MQHGVGTVSMQDAKRRRWQRIVLGLALPAAATATGMVALLASPTAFPRVVVVALALIVLLGVMQPARWAAQIVAACVAVAEIVVAVQRDATFLASALPDEPLSLGAGVGAAIGLLVVAVVADSYGRMCRRADQAQHAAQQNLDALKAIDALTNTTKWSHARLAF